VRPALLLALACVVGGCSDADIARTKAVKSDVTPLLCKDARIVKVYVHTYGFPWDLKTVIRCAAWRAAQTGETQ